MRVFRLVKNKYAATPFDSSGAKKHGGRWNSKGTPMVYTAGSESTAILEIAVHLNNTCTLNAYHMAHIDIPEDSILRLDASVLPTDWDTFPPPRSTAVIGDDWVKSNASLALAVPCAIAPGDLNYLVNADHRHFEKAMKTLKVAPYPLDPRLQK